MQSLGPADVNRVTRDGTSVGQGRSLSQGESQQPKQEGQQFGRRTRTSCGR